MKSTGNLCTSFVTETQVRLPVPTKARLRRQVLVQKEGVCSGAGRMVVEPRAKTRPLSTQGPCSPGDGSWGLSSVHSSFLPLGLMVRPSPATHPALASVWTHGGDSPPSLTFYNNSLGVTFFFLIKKLGNSVITKLNTKLPLWGYRKLLKNFKNYPADHFSQWTGPAHHSRGRLRVWGPEGSARVVPPPPGSLTLLPIGERAP